MLLAFGVSILGLDYSVWVETIAVSRSSIVALKDRYVKSARIVLIAIDRGKLTSKLLN